MLLVIGLVAVVVTYGISYMLWARSRRAQFVEVPPSETELMQARLDLHRVGAKVDVTLARQDARCEAEATKQAIAEALENRRW